MSTRPAISTRISRCQHRFAKGSRCRLPAAPNDVFCRAHRKNRSAEDVSVSLTTGLEDLKSPAAIHDLLSRILLLLAQDRISPRRAAVLFYGSGMLLRTIAAMQQETEDPSNFQYVIGVPRPDYDPPAGQSADPAPTAS